MMPHVRMEMLPQGYARIVFDQPDSKANVLSPAMWTDFEAAIDAVTASPANGVILASAKPGIFIAGADLKMLGQAKPKDPEVLAFLQQGLGVLHKLEELVIPTVAYIQGSALGGGLEVALACDVICYEDRPKTQVGFPEVNLGLIPGWGGTQRLPRWVDLVEANTMIRTAALLNPEEAELRHLGFRIGGEAQLFDVLAKVDVEKFRVTKLIPLQTGQRLSLSPNAMDEPAALREVTPLLIHGTRMPLYNGIEMESRAFMRLVGTEESKQKIADFFASRKK